MRLEQLYALVEIAQSSSMSKAAQKLHTSSQNVSKLIGQLESELNVILFTRSNQGVFLTPQGKAIYGMAEEIVKKTDNLRNYVEQLPMCNESVTGTLHLSSHINQTSMLVALIEKLYLYYPHIRLSLNTQLDLPTPEQFANGSIHAAFICLPQKTLNMLDKYKKEVDAYIYREDTLKVVMNTGSMYINQNALSLKTLSKLPFIDYAGDLHSTSFVRSLFSDHDLSSNIIFSCNDPMLTLEYIARNDAYCLGTNSIMQAHSHAAQLPIVLKPLKEKVTMYNLLLLTRNRKGCGKVVDAFHEVFTAQMQNEFEPFQI